MTLPRTIPSALLALMALFQPLGASAWTRAMHVEIARQAAMIAPPDLFRQIKRNEEAFVAGLSSSLESQRRRSQDGSGPNGRESLDQVETGARAAIAAIESHRPFAEIANHLGRLAIYAADANNPLVVSATDPQEDRYRADFEKYVASAAPRFPIVFYGQGRDVRTRSNLAALIGQTERRGFDLYPLIGLEYRRIGSFDGVRLFDDKSTAFGVGSLAFSHAVSDLAAIYRYVWLESGGADWRELPVTPPGAAAGALGR